MSFGGNALWALNQYGQSVMRIDPATGQVTETFLIPDRSADWRAIAVVGNQLFVLGGHRERGRPARAGDAGELGGGGVAVVSSHAGAPAPARSDREGGGDEHGRRGLRNRADVDARDAELLSSEIPQAERVEERVGRVQGEGELEAVEELASVSVDAGVDGPRQIGAEVDVRE
jgi:hypothetical protein